MAGGLAATSALAEPIVLALAGMTAAALTAAALAALLGLGGDDCRDLGSGSRAGPVMGSPAAR